MREEEGMPCNFKTDESELEDDVEELRGLVAAGGDPTIEEVDDEGHQHFARSQVWARPGGEQTKKERTEGGWDGRSGHDAETCP